MPARSGHLSRNIFKKLFLAQGWSFEGEFPNLPKAVAIISPHTSNIDAWHGFAALLGLGIKITVFGKHTLFNTPLKPLLEWIGVIPVNRSIQQGTTQQIIDFINTQQQIWVGMAPEGTRKQAESFRSGFYRIAVRVHIPIVMFSLDYKNKAIHCLGVFSANGKLCAGCRTNSRSLYRKIFSQKSGLVSQAVTKSFKKQLAKHNNYLLSCAQHCLFDVQIQL